MDGAPAAADLRLEIRSADTAAALDEIRGLFREYAESPAFEPSFRTYLAMQHFEEELAGLPGVYAPPSGRLLLATYDAHAAGCVAFKALAADVCEMKRLYVRPAFRAFGIGRALAESIVAAAREAGYHAMRLDTLPSMASAKKLYLSLGFREIQAYCENPVEGATFMEKELRG